MNTGRSWVIHSCFVILALIGCVAEAKSAWGFRRTWADYAQQGSGESITTFIEQRSSCGKEWPELTGHSTDMVLVIGLPPKASDALLNKWEGITHEFAQMIDNLRDAAELSRKIKERVSGFNQGIYSHRIFFHWGFNTLPADLRSYKNSVSEQNGLVVSIEKALAELPAAEQDKAASDVLSLIIQAQRQRNSAMMNVIPSADRQSSNAVAAILYNVHLLGDYIEGSPNTKYALYPLAYIKKDIENALRRLRCKDSEKVANAIKELQKTGSMYSSYPSDTMMKKTAIEMLKTLRQHVPEIIKASPVGKELFRI